MPGASAADGLGYEAQVVLVSELRRHTDNEDERDTVVELLHQLRARPDVVETVADDIDALLARLPLAGHGEDDAEARGHGGKDVYPRRFD